MSSDDEVTSRLDTLIKLVAAQVTSTMKSAAERAVYLSSLGVDRKAVAEITGMSTDAVSARVSEAKKRREAKEPSQMARGGSSSRSGASDIPSDSV